MRRSRRKLLYWTGGLALLVAGLGGAAVTGCLPPFNHWVEGRLLAALQASGLRAEDTQLRELSWRRAVVGPLHYRGPGLELQAAAARAELGWEVLLGRSAPRIEVSGLAAEVDLAQWNAFVASLPSRSGGEWPTVALEVESAQVVLWAGRRRVELALAGGIELAGTTLAAELVLDAPAARGHLGVHADLGAADTLQLDLRDGDLAAAEWRAVVAELLASPLALPAFGAAGRIHLAGTAQWQGGRCAALHGELSLPGGAWRTPDWNAELADPMLAVSFDGGAWREELRAQRAVLAGSGWTAELRAPSLVLEGGAGRLRFAAATVGGPETRLELGGEVTVRGLLGGGPSTAEATLHLEGGKVADWTVAEVAELQFRWDGAELVCVVPSLALGGACPLRFAEVEAEVGGWAEATPHVVAKGQVALEAAQICAQTGPGWQCSPGLVAAAFSANATLGAGAEAARVQFTVPAQRRTLVFPDGRCEAVVGGEAIVNLDRAHVSGRAALDLHEVLARCGAWSMLAPEAALEVRWPRVWQDALRRWGRVRPAELWRDVLWAGDYDLKTSDAIVRHGEGGWCATGVGAQFRARGAELHETGGMAFGLQIADLVDGTGLHLGQISLEAEGGLAGGELRLAGTLPDLGLTASAEEKIGWAEAFTAEGTFGFAPVVLTGKEPLARWVPQLRGIELSGGLGLNARNRFADGTWSLDGDLILQDLAVSWPERKTEVSGLRGRISWSGPDRWRTAPDQTLTFAQASFGGAELVGGNVTFGLEAPGALTVSQFKTGGLGGTVEAKPFAVDLRQPELDVGLLLNGVKLEQVLQLFDDVPAEAWGAMDGFVPIRWRDGRLSLGTGYIRLAPGEVGRMRFTRDLRLLTSGRKPGSPEYSALRRVEQAMLELVFNRLQIDTYPKDESGRSAQIRLVGVPADGEQRMPVSLDVNVNAPLEHFLNLGRPKASAP